MKEINGREIRVSDGQISMVFKIAKERGESFRKDNPNYMELDYSKHIDFSDNKERDNDSN